MHSTHTHPTPIHINDILMQSRDRLRRSLTHTHTVQRDKVAHGMNERKITPIFSFLFISLALSVSIHCHFGETHFTRTCSAPMHDAWPGIIKTNQWEVRWLALNWNLELDGGKGRGRSTHTTHLIDLIETLWIRLKWKWKPQHFGWVKSGPLRWNWSIWFKRFHDFIDHEWITNSVFDYYYRSISEWMEEMLWATQWAAAATAAGS